MLIGLAAVFATFAGLLAATIGTRRWPKYVVRLGAVLLALFAVKFAVMFFLANDTLIATILSLYENISDGSTAALAFIVSRFEPETFQLWQLRAVASTTRAAVAVILSALCGVSLVVAQRRFAEPPTRWLSAIRLGILTFFAVLAGLCVLDACLMAFQRNAIRERTARGDFVTVPKLLGNSDAKTTEVGGRHG
jgi:hypothetical protein